MKYIRTRIDKSFSFENVSIPVDQIQEEERVCTAVAWYINDINNNVLARANQPFSIALEMDTTNATNTVSLPEQTRKYLRRVADPPALDFVKSALRTLKIANRALRSFKLRLVLEPADTAVGDVEREVVA
jgi:hypothetical protein